MVIKMSGMKISIEMIGSMIIVSVAYIIYYALTSDLLVGDSIMDVAIIFILTFVISIIVGRFAEQCASDTPPSIFGMIIFIVITFAYALFTKLYYPMLIFPPIVWMVAHSITNTFVIDENGNQSVVKTLIAMALIGIFIAVSKYMWLK